MLYREPNDADTDRDPFNADTDCNPVNADRDPDDADRDRDNANTTSSHKRFRSNAAPEPWSSLVDLPSTRQRNAPALHFFAILSPRSPAAQNRPHSPPMGLVYSST